MLFRSAYLLTGVLGSTKVYAEYAGQKVSCWVRCSFKVDDTTDLPGTGGGTEEGAKEYIMKNNYGNTDPDVTIHYTVDAEGNIIAKDTIRLYLEEKGTGVRVTVVWTSSDTNIATVSDNKITAQGSGIAKITCEHEGKTYTYTVRVYKIVQEPATTEPANP